MLEGWNDIYAQSAAVRTAVLYAHVGGLLVGGGCAVAADRLTLLASPGDERQLRAIRGVHHVVVAGLTSMTISGVLLFAANIDTYLWSPVFWIKMLLVAWLVSNGSRLAKAERAARTGRPSRWAPVRTASMLSLALWVAVTFLGALLRNV